MEMFKVAISFLFEDFMAHLTSKERSEKPIDFVGLQKSNHNKLVIGIHRSCQFSVHSSKHTRGYREER